MKSQQGRLITLQLYCILLLGSKTTTTTTILQWNEKGNSNSHFLVSAQNAKDDNERPESWYHKYDRYPPYCSIPEEMDTRAVPPLPNVHRRFYGETRIQHVTAIVRHGARTPFASNEDCFPKFPTDPEDTEWNCKLTTIMTPPSSNLDSSFFLFEKFYDALPYLKDGLSNELNGTCQKGQLLMRGYEQELRNGAMLRDAYTYTYDSMDHDERMRLIELSFHEFSAWDPNHLRFRADHDQRTIMSGQVVLRGLLENEAEAYFRDTGKYPTIPLHIADRDRDIMSPNAKICPRLKEIANRARQSDGYQAFNNSKESMEIQYYMDHQIGRMDEDKILDCLMTTMCTDRDLPNVINDYGKPNSWFEKLAAYDVQDYTYVMKYNQSEHARLAMGPLWAEINDIWKLFVTRDNRGNHPNAEDGTVPPRLALYSGHDLTIMPLLASISPHLWNDTEWAPYASMLLVEIHEFIDDWNRTLFSSQYAFRLIYNGKVLTNQVPGCSPELELCDFEVLLHIIGTFATRSTDCAAEGKEEAPSGFSTTTTTVVNTKNGIITFFAIILLGAVAGASGAYILITWNLCSGKSFLSYSAIENTATQMDLQEEGDSLNSPTMFPQRFEDEPAISR